jgi:hypothetical protein
LQLGEAECVRLISAGGIGRLAYSARSGMAILPVSFQPHEGSIVVPTWMGYPSRRWRRQDGGAGSGQ